MLNVIKNYVHDNYPSKTAIAGGLICAAAAIEMAILASYDITQINNVAKGALEAFKYNLSANLGGAIFYSLCALNIIPRTAALGAGIFTLYSVINFQCEGAYLTSRFIGKTIKFISDEILGPICEHILIPIIRKIGDVAGRLIALVGKLIGKMPLPNHPVWIGVLILGGAIAIYKFGILSILHRSCKSVMEKVKDRNISLEEKVEQREKLRKQQVELEKSRMKDALGKKQTIDPLTDILRGYDRADISGEIAGVYVTSNETEQDKVQQILLSNPKKPNAIHIGFSGWFNFDMVADRHSAYALVADFNPSNALFLNYTLSSLRDSNTREEFVDAILQVVKETDIKFSLNVSSEGFASIEEEINNELNRAGSWLSTDERFQYVKKLAGEDKIAVLTNDICNTADFQEIAKVISANGFKIDTLYLSNISQYMDSKESQKAYRETLDALLQNDTLVVTCPKENLKQEIHSGQDFQGKNLY